MNNFLTKTGTAIFVILTLASCQYEQLNRSEFMSDQTGNAIAHNSALQIIDPWPRSAGDNILKVPSGDYGGEPEKKATTPAPIIIQTTGQ